MDGELKGKILKLITEHPGLNRATINTRVGRVHSGAEIAEIIESLISEGEVKGMISTQNYRHGRKVADYYPVRRNILDVVLPEGFTLGPRSTLRPEGARYCIFGADPNLPAIGSISPIGEGACWEAEAGFVDNYKTLDTWWSPQHAANAVIEYHQRIR